MEKRPGQRHLPRWRAGLNGTLSGKAVLPGIATLHPIMFQARPYRTPQTQPHRKQHCQTGQKPAAGRDDREMASFHVPLIRLRKHGYGSNKMPKDYPGFAIRLVTPSGLGPSRFAAFRPRQALCRTPHPVWPRLRKSTKPMPDRPAGASGRICARQTLCLCSGCPAKSSQELT